VRGKSIKRWSEANPGASRAARSRGYVRATSRDGSRARHRAPREDVFARKFRARGWERESGARENFLVDAVKPVDDFR
jgi:hypothetical protein